MLELSVTGARTTDSLTTACTQLAIRLVSIGSCVLEFPARSRTWGFIYLF